MNKQIELLNNKLDAQDKIINNQALEIARLKETIDIILEDNNQLEEIRIKAIEWVKKNQYYFPKPKELLEILGEKENE